jgi:L-alanine-DL-glutamate epimerase-like enolase superfamily enzyme
MAPYNVCSPIRAITEVYLCASLLNFEIPEYHAKYYDPDYFTVFDGSPRPRTGMYHWQTPRISV